MNKKGSRFNTPPSINFFGLPNHGVMFCYSMKLMLCSWCLFLLGFCCWSFIFKLTKSLKVPMQPTNVHHHPYLFIYLSPNELPFKTWFHQWTLPLAFKHHRAFSIALMDKVIIVCPTKMHLIRGNYHWHFQLAIIPIQCTMGFWK
jgi:hypothetical protein